MTFFVQIGFRKIRAKAIQDYFVQGVRRLLRPVMLAMNNGDGALSRKFSVNIR